MQQTSFLQLEDGKMRFAREIFLISEGVSLVHGFVRCGSLTFSVGELFNKAQRGSIVSLHNSLTKNSFCIYGYFVWSFTFFPLWGFSQRSIYTLQAGWASDVTILICLASLGSVLCTQLSKGVATLHDKQYFHLCVIIKRLVAFTTCEPLAAFL